MPNLPEQVYWINVEAWPPISGVQGIFTVPNKAKSFVENWVRKKSQHRVSMGGFSTLFFDNEEDAILFYMTFK